MITQVHLNHPFLTIHWDEGNDCVWVEWKRFVKDQELWDGLDAALRLLKEKGASRWLADIRSLSVLDMEDKDWSVDDARAWLRRPHVPATSPPEQRERP